MQHATREPRGQPVLTDRTVAIRSELLLLLLLPQIALGQTRPVALPTHSHSSLHTSRSHSHL